MTLRPCKEHGLLPDRLMNFNHFRENWKKRGRQAASRKDFVMKKRTKDPTKLIDEIQVLLSESKMELRAYSVLFQSLGPVDLSAEEFKGLSVVFDRIINTIEKTNCNLNEIYRSL